MTRPKIVKSKKLASCFYLGNASTTGTFGREKRKEKGFPVLLTR